MFRLPAHFQNLGLYHLDRQGHVNIMHVAGRMAGDQGATRYTMTNPFGYYRFQEALTLRLTAASGYRRNLRSWTAAVERVR